MTNKHEDLCAGFGHAVVGFHDCCVVVLASDLTTVDAALIVAPLDHGLHCVGHFLVKARGAGVTSVIAVTDGD